MSFIRSQLVNRLLPSSGGVYRRATPSSMRWAQTVSGQYQSSTVKPEATSEASDSPEPSKGDSEMIRQEDSKEGLVDHQPDYHAPIDHGTSQFSPIPRRVMDGSEPGEFTPAAVLSGAPVDLQARTARRAIGMATTGEWIGTSSKRVTDGKIHSWDGNPLQTTSKERT
ncbi:MAG: hypothetical protein Q9164_004577 [Protoblastenia rupestris]